MFLACYLPLFCLNINKYAGRFFEQCSQEIFLILDKIPRSGIEKWDREPNEVLRRLQGCSRVLQSTPALCIAPSQRSSVLDTSTSFVCCDSSMNCEVAMVGNCSSCLPVFTRYFIVVSSLRVGRISFLCCFSKPVGILHLGDSPRPAETMCSRGWPTLTRLAVARIRDTYLFINLGSLRVLSSQWLQLSKRRLV